ncbi:SOS response-associated peptidase family protein [Aliiroseovarius sp. S1339]|uniref:SOS response-associated peptidase n=1 Tax=Aliiroseovarius sp. S1339 TaxID=2936990 RepID=UPI0020C0EAC1|nr:SOS response-associated peptidase family protein [Aliiroseovarius sp. S1339]MCK8463174.1 SOS response-associated peptidase family protein [Aliiroseovarius sp. S1339]
MDKTNALVRQGETEAAFGQAHQPHAIFRKALLLLSVADIVTRSKRKGRLSAMCNLYSSKMPPEAMRQLFDVPSARDLLGNAEPLPAIYPKYLAPIVTTDQGGLALVKASWGFLTPNKSKKTGKWLKPSAWNNTRDDKIRTASLWRDSFENRRCLIPGTAYAEATGRNPATFHWFDVKGTEGFAFAGIWKQQTATVGDTDVDGKFYSMVTTAPNELAAKYHNRMPVIISPSDYEEYLTGDPGMAFNLLRPFPADQMQVIGSGEGLRSEPG